MSETTELRTTLAITEAVQRLRDEEHKTIDEVIALLRASTNEMIEGLRVEAIFDALGEGETDMATLCARAKAKGCTLHAAQVKPVIDESVKQGEVVATEVASPGRGGRPKTVYRFVDAKTDTSEGAAEPVDGGGPNP